MLEPKWIQELEAKQQAHGDRRDLNLITNLTVLLITGQVTEGPNNVLDRLSE